MLGPEHFVTFSGVSRIRLRRVLVKLLCKAFAKEYNNAVIQYNNAVITFIGIDTPLLGDLNLVCLTSQ